MVRICRLKNTPCGILVVTLFVGCLQVSNSTFQQIILTHRPSPWSFNQDGVFSCPSNFVWAQLEVNGHTKNFCLGRFLSSMIGTLSAIFHFFNQLSNWILYTYVPTLYSNVFLLTWPKVNVHHYLFIYELFLCIQKYSYLHQWIS